MKVSVVIAAFNEEEYVGRCLDALNSQKVKPDEIIVVDNNSTDHTAKIAKEKGARVIKEARQGASYARNKGFDSAVGDIILRTDADTIVPKNWVMTMEKHFSDPQVSIVCGGVLYYKKWLNPLSHFLIYWIDDIFGYKAITGPNFGIRRDIWRRVRDEVHAGDLRFHEDLDLSIHAQRFGKYIRDYDLTVTTSSRKVGNIGVFFIDYPSKWIRTVFHPTHRKLSSNPLMKI